MTRKQDSMVSANNVPPPTENEAWRERKRLHRPLHWYFGTVHVHFKQKNWPKSQRLSHRTQWFHQNDFRTLSDILVLWWEMGRGCVEVLMREVLEAWLCFCAFFHYECCFVRASAYGNMVTLTGSQADALSCWLHCPGYYSCLLEWKDYWSCGYSSTYLMEGILLRLGRYLNTSNWTTFKRIICKNKCWLILMYLYKVPHFYFILCTIYWFEETVICIHNVFKCHWCHDSNINPNKWQHIVSFAQNTSKDSVNINMKKKNLFRLTLILYKSNFVHLQKKNYFEMRRAGIWQASRLQRWL